jgi:hypothetical protein
MAKGGSAHDKAAARGCPRVAAGLLRASRRSYGLWVYIWMVLRYYPGLANTTFPRNFWVLLASTCK